MENVNKQILEDYRLAVSRLDILKAEVKELTISNKMLKRAFIDLLDSYQGELDRRGDNFYDRTDVDYHWLDRAGILD